jgi:hypothetical protein
LGVRNENVLILRPPLLAFLNDAEEGPQPKRGVCFWLRLKGVSIMISKTTSDSILYPVVHEGPERPNDRR